MAWTQTGAQHQRPAQPKAFFFFLLLLLFISSLKYPPALWSCKENLENMIVCKPGQQIFLSLQATEPKVPSGKKIACTFCSTKFSRRELKRLTLGGSHLVSSVDTAYVHSLNLLLMIPSLLQCLNLKLLIWYQLGVVYLSCTRRRKNNVNIVFTHAFRANSQKSALKRRIFLMNFHED